MTEAPPSLELPKVHPHLVRIEEEDKIWVELVMILPAMDLLPDLFLELEVCLKEECPL